MQNSPPKHARLERFAFYSEQGVTTFVTLEVARLHHGILMITDDFGHGTRCATGCTSALRCLGREFDPSAAPLWHLR